MNHKQLTQEERYQIYALIKANHNQKEIAKILERSASSISREIKRNKGLKGHRPKQPQRLMLERALKCSRRCDKQSSEETTVSYISNLSSNSVVYEQSF